MRNRYLKVLMISISAVWTIAEAGTWEVKSSIPTTRKAPSAAEANGRIYVFGGCGGSRITEEYDPITDSWSAKTNLSERRGCGAVAREVGGKIYVIGGRRAGQPRSFNTKYDPVTDSWTTMSPMPTARMGISGGVVNGRIYVIGGHCGTSPLNTVEEYNPATDSWTTRAPMPTARAYLTAVAIDGKIYVIGGHDGTSPLATVEVYDPATDSWTTKAPMPTARFWLAASAVGGEFWVIGGFDGTNWLNTVERYDPVGDSWSTDTPMPTARSHLVAVEANGKIYAIGGLVVGGARTGANEVFTPVVGIEEEQTFPESFYLANYPNPFSHETAINYHIVKDGYVSVRIYNILGQEILTLFDAYKKAGSYTLYWNGKDEHGNEVKGGVYFYRMEKENFTTTRRMTLIR